MTSEMGGGGWNDGLVGKGWVSVSITVPERVYRGTHHVVSKPLGLAALLRPLKLRPNDLNPLLVVVLEHLGVTVALAQRILPLLRHTPGSVGLFLLLRPHGPGPGRTTALRAGRGRLVTGTGGSAER